MTVVTGSNIYSETWNILHSLISGNVNDPILSIRSADKLKWIFGAYPDVEKTRPNFPIIVIENPKADRTPQTLGYGYISNGLSSSIWAYSKSNQQVNEINDDIQDALLQSRQSILGSNLSLINVTTGAIGTDIVANQRIHFKETIVNYKLLSMSA